MRVKVNQSPRDDLSLGGVRFEQVGFGGTGQDRAEFPAEVPSVLHRRVHSLTRFRRVGVAGVAGKEDSICATERLGHTLADMITCVPLDVLSFESVRVEDLARRREDRVGRDLAAVEVLARLDLNRELDVQPDETFRLRNNHDRTGVGAVYGASHTNVGKVGQGDHIEDPPDKVGLVADHLDAELPPGPAVSAIAADEVPRLDRLDLVLVALLAVEFRRGQEEIRSTRRIGLKR